MRLASSTSSSAFSSATLPICLVRRTESADAGISRRLCGPDAGPRTPRLPGRSPSRLWRPRLPRRPAQPLPRRYANSSRQDVDILVGFSVATSGPASATLSSHTIRGRRRPAASPRQRPWRPPARSARCASAVFDADLPVETASSRQATSGTWLTRSPACSPSWLRLLPCRTESAGTAEKSALRPRTPFRHVVRQGEGPARWNHRCGDRRAGQLAESACRLSTRVQYGA